MWPPDKVRPRLDGCLGQFLPLSRFASHNDREVAGCQRPDEGSVRQAHAGGHRNEKDGPAHLLQVEEAVLDRVEAAGEIR